MTTNPIIALMSGACARFVQAPGDKPLPTVLLVHGWKSQDPLRDGGSYSKIQELLKGAGYHSLALSLRGHAGSEGDLSTVTRAEHLADIAAACAWLKRQPEVDSTRLSGYATSYGAYLLAASPWVAAMKLLAFRVPALYPNDGWDEPTQSAVDSPGLKAWRKAPHGVHESLALEGIAKFRGYLLIVSSEHDEYMPSVIVDDYQVAASEAASFKHFVQPGTKHVLTEAENVEFLGILQEWFQSH